MDVVWVTYVAVRGLPIFFRPLIQFFFLVFYHLFLK